MAEPRHRLAPVVLAGLAVGILAAVAGNQTWASLDETSTADAVFASASTAARDATAPPVTALALVLLATWGVVLVSRGRARRAVTWLGLLAAVGVAGFAAAAWLTTPDALVAGSAPDQQTSRTIWSYIGVLAGVAAVAASVLATRSVRHWPEMGRRYDAPGDGSAPTAADVPMEEQTNLDLWRAIDEGRDPTEGSTH